MTHCMLLACGLASAVLLAACPDDADSGTGLLASFEGSECKRDEDQPATASLTAALDDADAGSEATGATNTSGSGAEPTCAAYALDGEKLTVKLTNLHGPCGVHEWKGDVAFENGKLTLKSKNANQDCIVAKCGACIYDFDFVVNGVQKRDELPVVIEVGECADGSGQRTPKTYTLSFSFHEYDRGSACGDFSLLE